MPGPPPPLLSSKRAARLDPACLFTAEGRLHPRLRGCFRCRSPASCNRNDSRARLLGPHRARPERARLPSPAGAWRQRSCEHRRPALLGPGGRERLSPHRPRPGNAWRSYPETDPCRAPRFMSPSRRRLENRLRAASPPLGTRPPVEPRLRRIPRRTRRTACAGAPARGLRLVRITYRGSSAVPPPRRGSPARCTQGAFRPMKRTRSAPGLPTDCHQPVE
jgi:hypothetical protein